MDTPTPPLRLCLLRAADQAPVEQALGRVCSDPDTLTVMILDEGFHGRMETHLPIFRQADALIVAWNDEATSPIAFLHDILRGLNVPLIALCDDRPESHVSALEAGADEILVMPLYMPLLRARLRALRRYAGEGAPAPAQARGAGPTIHTVPGLLTVDLTARKVQVRGEPVEFTQKEFDLLAYLLDRKGQVCTRDEILDAVWGIDFDTGTNMVDVYMFYLRAKLKKHQVTGLLQTVRGRGYLLSAPGRI